MTVKFKDLGKEICINASKDVLNTICCMAWSAVAFQELEGHFAIRSEYENFARSIYESLDSVGYYDDCK